MEWKFGVSGCKLSNGEWINSKALLYSTGNYSQHPAINQNGKEHEKDCVCVCAYIYIYTVVQSLSRVQLCTSTLGFPALRCLLQFAQTHVH